jgi:hypothetical protein
VRLEDGCGKTRPEALLMEEIVTRTRDGEGSPDLATHKSLYITSHCRLRLLRGGTFQNVERK